MVVQVSFLMKLGFEWMKLKSTFTSDDLITGFGSSSDENRDKTWVDETIIP